jgi:hypothetical protein
MVPIVELCVSLVVEPINDRVRVRSTGLARSWSFDLSVVARLKNKHCI